MSFCVFNVQKFETGGKSKGKGVTKTAGKGKGARKGKGKGKGRGKGKGKGKGKGVKVTEDSLDAALANYMGEEHVSKGLDADLDAYFSKSDSEMVAEEVAA